MILVEFYDSSLKRLNDKAIAALSFDYTGKRNAPLAGTLSIAQVDYLPGARYAAICIDDRKTVASVITQPEVAGGVVKVRMVGIENLLENHYVPKKWGGWESMLAGDFVENMGKYFDLKKYTSVEDFGTYIAKDKVAIDSLFTGDICLELYEWSNGERFYNHGWVVYYIDLGADCEDGGRCFRWSEKAGRATKITIQALGADVPFSGLPSFVDVAEQTAFNAGGIERNETVGVTLPSSGRYLAIRINLRWDDAAFNSSKDFWKGDTGSGEVFIYGFTPVLQGFEIVSRKKTLWEPGIKDVPSDVITNESLDRQSFWSVLHRVAEQQKWRIALRFVRPIKLGQKARLFLDVAQSLGQDYSRHSIVPRVLTDGVNCTISPTRNEPKRLVTVLHCWGSGEGADQLYTKIMREDLLAHGWPVVEDNFENKNLETRASLDAAGIAEMAAIWNVENGFEVETAELFGLDDLVTVVHKSSGQVIDDRVFEEKLSYNGRSLIAKIGVGRLLFNPMRRLLDDDFPPVPAPSYVSMPEQLSAVGSDDSIVLKWIGTSESYIVGYRIKPLSGEDFAWEAVTTTATTFTLPLADNETVYQFWVIGVIGDAKSEQSATVEAKAKRTVVTHSEFLNGFNVDGGTTAPDAPVLGGSCLFQTAYLGWNAQPNLTGVVSHKVYRSLSVGGPYTAVAEVSSYLFQDANLTLGGTVDAPTSRDYWYQVSRVVNGVEGGLSNAVKVTASPIPSGSIEAASIKAIKVDLENLFAQAIKVNAGGTFRAGNRFAPDGSVANANAAGVFIGANGAIMALDADGTGFKMIPGQGAEFIGLALELTDSDLSTVDPDGNRLRHELAQLTWTDSEGAEQATLGFNSGLQCVISDNVKTPITVNSFEQLDTLYSTVHSFLYAYKDKVYIYARHTKSMQILDIKTKQVSQSVFGLGVREVYCPIGYDGKIYLPFNNYEWDNGCIDITMCIYDCQSGVFSNIDMPSGYFSGNDSCGVGYNDKIYIPVIHCATNIPTIRVFNIATSSWEEISYNDVAPTMNIKKMYIYENSLYATSDSVKLLKINLQALDKTVLLDYVGPMTDMAGLIYGDYIYFTGPGGDSTAFWIFNLKSNSLEISTLPTTRLFPVAAFGGMLFFAKLNSVELYIYNVTDKVFAVNSFMPPNSYNHAIFYKGRLYNTYVAITNKIDIITLANFYNLGAGFTGKGTDGTGPYYELFDGAKIRISGTSLTAYVGPKGDKGDKGDQGDKGDTGNDGYTPIKGVDYFDGEKGDTGNTGPQGSPGTTVPTISGLDIKTDTVSQTGDYLLIYESATGNLKRISLKDLTKILDIEQLTLNGYKVEID